MALGTPIAAAIAYSASGGTSVAPAYPASILATDQLVMFVGMKPSTANGGTLTQPTGWTIRDSLTGAGGYATTLAADSGNTNLWVLTKDTVTAGQTGTQSVTVGVNNICFAFIVRVPTGGGSITYGSSDGSDITAGNVSVLLAANPGLTVGDLGIWAMCIPTDVTTPGQFSAHAISATGATFATPVELNEPDNTLGNDIGGFSAWTTVASGTASAAPTITATAGGTTTNVRGPLVFLRLRETLAERTGDFNATEAGSDSFSGTGSALGAIQGDFSATEVADYLFATNVGDVPTDLFAVAENGAWFDAEPISRFQTTSTSGVALTSYGNSYGRWIDRSGNVNDLFQTDLGSRGTAFDVRGVRAGGIYYRLESTGGGGSTTAFYCCVSLLGISTLYSATIFSDINTANTGFRLQRNGDAPGADIIFTIGTGSSRTSVTAPSGRPNFGFLLDPIVLEAWFDGSSIYLRVNRGVTNSALVGSSAAAGTSNFLIGAVDVANTDPLYGRLHQIVYSKNAFPDGATRNSIAQFAAIKGAVPLAQLAPAGNLASTEASDTFAASGTITSSAVTGTLAASELGDDSFASTGAVVVQGSLVGAESGADSFAASGTVSGGAITGQLAATEAGEDVFASTGNVVVAGALAATEAADSFAATGQIIVQGLLDATELADTFASAGRVLVQGALASTEGVDLFAASGQVLVQGSFIGSESSDDFFESTGLVLVQGLLASSEDGQDVFAATGSDVAQGLLEVTEASDALAAEGSVLIQGGFAATESGDDLFAATGVVVTLGVSVSLSSTETGSDAFEAIGQSPVQGIAAITELGADDLAGTGSVLVRGTANAAEDGTDNFFAFGGSVSVGSFDATEFGADVFSGTSNVLVAGTFAGIELGSDLFLASGQLFIQGSVSATEDFDQSAISGQVFLRGAFDALESSDIFGSNAFIYTGERLQKGILVKRLAASASSRPLTTSADHDNNQTGRRSNRGNYVGRGQSTPSR